MNTSYIHKVFCQKNMIHTWFAGNFNINNTIAKFDKKINDILDKKIIYFWNRNIRLFELIDKVKNNTSNTIEDQIFSDITSKLWNREFIKALYAIDDNRANGIIKFLEF